MPALKNYGLFISHAWNYNEDYYKMVDYLRSAPNFDWRNHSVPEHDPLPMDELAKRLYNQIYSVNSVIVIAGMYVPRSDWIIKEIEIAQKLRKPIIGVKPWGAQVVPTVVQSAAKEIVGWNTSSIIDAVRRWSN